MDGQFDLGERLDFNAFLNDFFKSYSDPYDCEEYDDVRS